jgi:DNA-binding protein
MTDLPNSAVARIAKKNGVERIGKDATVALVEQTEKFIVEVSKKAVALAKHAGRTTVKAEDITLAVGAPASA